MSMKVELHNVSNVAAEVVHGDSAHWVELMFESRPPNGWHSVTPSNITVFFDKAWMADAFAAAVNSVNRPHVASNTVELMQQLRDSVALCDAERAP